MELRFEDDPLARSFVAASRSSGRSIGRSGSRRTNLRRPSSPCPPRRAASPLRWRARRLGSRVDRDDLAGETRELGRLQFEDHGDGVLEVHIPETGPLDPAACDAPSLARATSVPAITSRGARRGSSTRGSPTSCRRARTSCASSGASSFATRAPRRTVTSSASSSTRTEPISTGSPGARRSSAPRRAHARRRKLAGADRGNLAAMTATLLDGKALGAKVREEVAASVAEVGHVGLATILVGDDPASHVYIDLKQKKLRPRPGWRRATSSSRPTRAEEDVIATIAALNADDGDRRPPRPASAARPHRREPDHRGDRAGEGHRRHPSGQRGQRSTSAGRRSCRARRSGSCGCSTSTRSRSRARAPSSIGRSAIVGKPMAHLLLQRNATVTICHSRTQDLQRHTLDADVLVAAVGRPHLDLRRHGQGGRDGGRRRDEPRRASQKLLGDVDPGAIERAAYITPVPGGVGPMTIAMVLQNTVTAARCAGPGLLHPPQTEVRLRP